MKSFIILAAVAWAQAAKLDRVYLPPNAQASAGSSNFLQTPRQSFDGVQSQNNNGFSRVPISNTNTYATNAYSGIEVRPENINSYTGASVNNYAQNAYSGYDARSERAQAALERNAAILRQDNSNDGETYSYAYETENGIYAEENGVATNGVQAQGGYSYTGDDGNVYSIRYTADENGFVPQGDHLPTPPPVPEEILKALEQNARDEAAGIYDDGSYSEGKYSAAGDSQPINNYNEDSLISNSAVNNNGGRFNGNSLTKTYLPPFEQRSNLQRNGNYNARNGYRY